MANLYVMEAHAKRSSDNVRTRIIIADSEKEAIEKFRNTGINGDKFTKENYDIITKEILANFGDGVFGYPVFPQHMNTWMRND